MIVKTKHVYARFTKLPSEIWIEIFRIATFFEDFDEVNAFADGQGDQMFTGRYHLFRQALVRFPSLGFWSNVLQITRRYIVRVCKLWYYLAAPFLYQRVLLGRIRVVQPLLAGIERSLARNGDGDAGRPYPTLIRRLDIKMRDDGLTLAQDPIDNLNAIAQIVSHLPMLEALTIAASERMYYNAINVCIPQLLAACPPSLKVLFFQVPSYFESYAMQPHFPSWQNAFRDFYASHPLLNTFSNRMNFQPDGLHLQHVWTVCYFSQTAHLFPRFLDLDFPAL